MKTTKSASGELQELIGQSLDLTAGTVDGLASDLGVSYHTLWGWQVGRRTPSAAAVRHLAATAEERARDLKHLAEKLRQQAEHQEIRRGARAR